MRSLASVQRIIDKKPIEGADLIEAVKVNGWWCVAKKDQFHVGDLCVYFEVDSVLPEIPEYEYLRKSCYVSKDWIKGFRLKTIKLRGQISQGLVIPLTMSPAVEFQDLTEELGVKKWDPPIDACIAGEIKGNFPSFLRKTDQERIQNIYGNLPHLSYEATLKLDGTSCTIYKFNEEPGVCSRNLEYKLNEANKNNTLVQLGLEILSKVKGNIAIQGEVMGPGIQGNREKLKVPQIFIFDVFDIDRQSYFNPAERRAYIQSLGLTHVPVIHEICYPLRKSLEEILKDSEVKSINHPVAEGIVYKCNSNAEVSFKALNNQFLLGEK